MARRYGVHRSWVYRLKARYETEGTAAFEPRSRLKSAPTVIDPRTAEAIVQLRKELTEQRLDAGGGIKLPHHYPGVG